MRGGLTRFARRWWAGGYGLAGALVSVALLPVSALWRAGMAVRNRRFDRGGSRGVAGAWVVSVGNLGVGGTGKTPFASWAAQVLAADGGYRPSLLLRGYGTDEVLLHRSWTPDFPVVAMPDRVAGVGRAVEKGATAVVLDDGFQHRRLARDVDLVLMAVEDPWPVRVLPRGPYREPARALRRADAIVLTRRSASRDDAEARAAAMAALPGLRPGAVRGCVRIASVELEPLRGGDPAPATALPNPGRPWVRALALTAIARPESFREDVEHHTGAEVELMAFGDHHEFSEADAQAARLRAGGRPLVVTEKDAVKLRGLAAELGETWVLRQRLTWDWGEPDVRALICGAGGGATDAPGHRMGTTTSRGRAT